MVFFGSRGGQGIPPSNHCKSTNTLGGQATRVGTRATCTPDVSLLAGWLVPVGSFVFFCARGRGWYTHTHTDRHSVCAVIEHRKRENLKKTKKYVVQKKTVVKGGRRSRVVPRFENDALILPSAVESNAEKKILDKTGRSRRQYNSIQSNTLGYGFVGPSPPLLAKFCNDILRTTLFTTTTFSLVYQPTINTVTSLPVR